MRDFVSDTVQKALNIIKELEQQENNVDSLRGWEKREAEQKAKEIRTRLLEVLSPAVAFGFLKSTGRGSTDSLRILWQEKNFDVDCLANLARDWKEGLKYYQDIFAVPRIDLALFPTFSFVIQFTFTLAQSYISRDEQSFYIIDNPVRKDKIFGLPYVAPSSWKGSLRAALWQLGNKKDNEHIRHLFGNEKEVENQEERLLDHERETENEEGSRSGRLHFFPTFFTRKGLEIINPQDRKLRVGSNPIAFESVPRDSEGNFTLLYVPFDRIGEDEKTTREQVTEELRLVIEGLQAMFRVYGFGAKTSSGFGLAKEGIKGTLNIKAAYQQIEFKSLSDLLKSVDKFASH